MRMKGFVQKDCTFACYSLGECSALTSIADVLHISALVDVVFYCDITMQPAVELCDAVNPSHISPTFSDATRREVFDTISGSLLEIANYNIEVSF